MTIPQASTLILFQPIYDCFNHLRISLSYLYYISFAWLGNFDPHSHRQNGLNIELASFWFYANKHAWCLYVSFLASNSVTPRFPNLFAKHHCLHWQKQAPPVRAAAGTILGSMMCYMPFSSGWSTAGSTHNHSLYYIIWQQYNSRATTWTDCCCVLKLEDGNTQQPSKCLRRCHGF